MYKIRRLTEQKIEINRKYRKQNQRWINIEFKELNLALISNPLYISHRLLKIY